MVYYCGVGQGRAGAAQVRGHGQTRLAPSTVRVMTRPILAWVRSDPPQRKSGLFYHP